MLVVFTAVVWPFSRAIEQDSRKEFEKFSETAKSNYFRNMESFKGARSWERIECVSGIGNMQVKSSGMCSFPLILIFK